MSVNLQKFLGVRIDENLACRDHIHTVENKIAQNIGHLYEGKNRLKQIYFAYLHAYLNFANIPWTSSHKTDDKTIVLCRSLEIRTQL